MSRHRPSGPTNTLYVRNISDRVRYDDLRRLFSKYGKLVDVVIPLDYYSGTPKGYCFVEYEDIRDAEEAQYRMDRQRLFGREIEVEFARGIRKSSNEMRTRDRHFGGGAGGRTSGGSRDGRDGGRDYPRTERRGRSRSGSRGRSDRRERRGEREPVDGNSGRSRSRSRSFPSNRTPSPAPRNNRYKSASKDRSRSPRERSGSRQNSPSPRRPAAESRSMSREADSPVINKRDHRSPKTSRSQSPA